MDPGVKVSIIAAVAANGVIGRDGNLPWRRLKSDLKRFRRLTVGRTVIVGRKTHESILRRLGHPLEGRYTIVVTRDPKYIAEGCEVATSFEEALFRARNAPEVFVIGGGELYSQALPIADLIYLTKIEVEVPGDAKFPAFDRAAWIVCHTEAHAADSENEFSSSFEILERRTNPPARQSYLNFNHTRETEQVAVMEEIKRLGICPFCPEHIREYGPRPVLHDGKHWFISRNTWPYRFTRLHFIFTPKAHAERLSDLTAAAWAELFELLQLVESVCRLSAGAIGLRFGNPSETGATIRHLHIHLIVADQNVSQPGYERVRFPMGPKPAAQ